MGNVKITGTKGSLSDKNPGKITFPIERGFREITLTKDIELKEDWFKRKLTKQQLDQLGDIGFYFLKLYREI